MNTITLICTIIGAVAGIYGILTYYREHIQKPSVEIKHVYDRTKWAKDKVDKLVSDMTNYAEQNNGWQIEVNGLSIQLWVANLKQIQEIYTETNVNNILKNKRPNPYTDNILKNVEDLLPLVYDLRTHFEVEKGNLAPQW